eukprot:1861438-Pyramimonas_sp.AAC.1
MAGWWGFVKLMWPKMGRRPVLPSKPLWGNHFGEHLFAPMCMRIPRVESYVAEVDSSCLF